MINADPTLIALSDYVANTKIKSEKAYETARLCLADSLGCAILSLNYPECTKLLGPIIPDTTVPFGSAIPGTNLTLDPIRAAFNIGTMIRWLDYNDTFLAKEWGHPSDNLGGLLAISDYLSRKKPLSVRDLLTAMIKAYEIQGGLSLENSFNQIGFDHVILVKIASTALCTHLLGGNQEQIMSALSHAFIDTGPLRTYRHAPNTGSRKSWAAGDATSRAAFFAWITMQEEMGYPLALSAKQWGFDDILLPVKLPSSLNSYVMENILFKVSFPAEFHAQTAVEAAFQLHPIQLDKIQSIEIETQNAATRIIDKTGPLHNPADRDHCLQYMVAIGLLFGELNADHYEDETAADPRIDKLRALMTVKENSSFSQDYLDPKKRSIANSIQVHFKDGTSSEKILVEYPLGHRMRRDEAVPLLHKKFEENLLTRFPQSKVDDLLTLFQDPDRLDQMPIHHLMDTFRVAAE